MKFVCENCKAKYQIGDEKVAGKTLRMKCRRCGNMIQVSSAVTESSVSRANPAGTPRDAGELTGAELLLTGVHAAVSAPAANDGSGTMETSGGTAKAIASMPIGTAREEGEGPVDEVVFAFM